jgi:hypothetical protein
MEKHDPSETVRNSAHAEAAHGSVGVGSRITPAPRSELRRWRERDVRRATTAPAAGRTTAPDQPDPVARPSPGPEGEAPSISMDILSLLRLFVRHWRVTGPAVLLTLVALLVAVQNSSPTYQATGSVALLSPPSPP